MMLKTQLLPPHTDDDRFWIESTFFEPNSKKNCYILTHNSCNFFQYKSVFYFTNKISQKASNQVFFNIKLYIITSKNNW